MNVTVFRLAWVFSTAYNPPCLPRVSVLPSPWCKVPGPLADLLGFALSHMLKPQYRDFRLRLVPTQHYSSPDGFTNDSSIVSLIHRGEADFAPPYMTMNRRRFGLTGYTPVTYYNTRIVLYRKPPQKRAVLTVAALLPFRLFQLISFTTALHIPRKFSCLQPQGHFPALEFAREMMGTVLLELVASFVTTLFTEPLPEFGPFQKPQDIFTQKEYRYLSFTPIIAPILKLYDEKNSKGYGRSEIEIKPATEEDAFSRDPRLLWTEKVAWIGDTTPLILQPWEKYCDLHYFRAENLPGARHIFFNPRIKDKLLPMTSALTSVLSQEAIRRGLLPQNPRRECRKVEPCPCLLLSQIQLAFRLLAYALALAALALAVENASAILRLAAWIL